ncbi:hypothetical protein CRI93_11925 [Longimonas halophila]|uniref:DUF3857 domain-containing protein n=1 Tax=Longimonas halophila TaxID=1469170 RepID=A0A2H3NJG1_9BACT|nr:DUF3857 and transglutaminase domain-containing protein [Longimonas halophila]PEN05803.1 hypothetical protein CRI93_11925 [Longimonas halophila]
MYRSVRPALTALLFFLALHAAPASAQPIDVPDEPAEWGEVSMNELEMDHYPADSNATAVVLSDYGETSFRPNGRLSFERHRRIKILSEEAYDDWGTVEITYYDEDDTEHVDNIEAHTVVLNSNGEQETYELDEDEIFEEDIDGTHQRITFTLPNLQPGAVIEYAYRIRSYQPHFLRSWTFQTTEPTLYSEYKTRIPEVFQYAILSQGSQPYDVQERDETNFSPRLRGTDYRWVMKEVPALRAEPYMTTLENHRAKIRFQLQSVNPPKRRSTSVMGSWEELTEDLLDHDKLGDQVGDHRAVRNEARDVIDGIEAPDEQLRALYDHVVRAMSWDNNSTIYAQSDLDDVLERGSGSSAEINLLLASMLQEADVAMAAPVLISTRSHGKTMPMYPFLSQFNDLLVAVSLGEETLLLDATDPHRPMGMLPLRALNDNGYLLHEDNAQWIQIPRTTTRQHTFFAQGTLHLDGTIDATVRATYDGSSITTHRSEYAEADDDISFVKDTVFDRYDRAEITESSIEIPERRSEAVVVDAGVTLPAYARTAADFIYLNPTLLGRWGENPFQIEERTYPVDFGYPMQVQQVLSLQLPEEYAIAEKPENAQVQFMDNGGGYTRLIQAQGSRLTVRQVFMLRQPVIGPANYEALRDFFTHIVEMESQPLVLRKVANAESGTDSSTPNSSSEETSESAPESGARR